MPKTTKKAPKKADLRVSFNHAMIYSSDVALSMQFYEGILGLRLIEAFPPGRPPVYARYRAGTGETSIALHQAESKEQAAASGIRLYFEVKELDALCERLAAEGVAIKQMPKLMPWGWRHAYLDDPDGHEVSLYWAGRNRFRKTDEKAMRRASGR